MCVFVVLEWVALVSFIHLHFTTHFSICKFYVRLYKVVCVGTNTSLRSGRAAVQRSRSRRGLLDDSILKPDVLLTYSTTALLEYTV